MQLRRQSACVRHEDMMENSDVFVVEMKDRFNLRTRPGFPVKVERHTLHEAMR